jgi:hypothetical protein
MYIVEKQEWKMAFRLHTFALSTQALHHPPSSSLHLQGDSVGSIFVISFSVFPTQVAPEKAIKKREHWIHKSSTRMLIRRNTDGTYEDLHKKETFFPFIIIHEIIRKISESLRNINTKYKQTGPVPTHPPKHDPQ